MTSLRGLPIVLATPAVVLFVLAAHPARLYAEAAPAPLPCGAPEILACSGLDAGSACTLEAGAGACQVDLCSDLDSGFNVQSLRCRLPFVQPEPQPEAGPDANTDDASAADGSAGDASVDATASADAAAPPSGGSPSLAGGGGCDLGGHDEARAGAAVLGLALAVAFATRRRRRCPHCR
ncbi:MAG: hypothetical protein U0235_15785 [Polyangiaceae bacterium]